MAVGDKGKKGKSKHQLLKEAEERSAQAEELGKTSEGKVWHHFIELHMPFHT